MHAAPRSPTHGGEEVARIMARERAALKPSTFFGVFAPAAPEPPHQLAAHPGIANMTRRVCVVVNVGDLDWELCPEDVAAGAVHTTRGGNDHASLLPRVYRWRTPRGLAMTHQAATEELARGFAYEVEAMKQNALVRPCTNPTRDTVRETLRALFADRPQDERVVFWYCGEGLSMAKPHTAVPRAQRGRTVAKEYCLELAGGRMSLAELLPFDAAPHVLIFDCERAGAVGTVVDKLHDDRAAEERRSGFRQRRGAGPQRPMYFACCGDEEGLPSHPLLPTDILTACLLTPVKMALLWHVVHHYGGDHPGVPLAVIHTLPEGKPGEHLKKILLTVAECIAFDSAMSGNTGAALTENSFRELFRDDRLLVDLFCNYLLADRILSTLGYHPRCSPRLPPSRGHPMWDSWDLTMEATLTALTRALHPLPGAAPLPDPAATRTVAERTAAQRQGLDVTSCPYAPAPGDALADVPQFYDAELATMLGHLDGTPPVAHEPVPAALLMRIPVLLPAAMQLDKRTGALLVLARLVDGFHVGLEVLHATQLYDRILNKVWRRPQPQHQALYSFVAAKTLAAHPELVASAHPDLLAHAIANLRNPQHEPRLGPCGTPAATRALAAAVLLLVLLESRHLVSTVAQENVAGDIVVALGQLRPHEQPPGQPRHGVAFAELGEMREVSAAYDETFPEQMPRILCALVCLLLQTQELAGEARRFAPAVAPFLHSAQPRTRFFAVHALRLAMLVSPDDTGDPHLQTAIAELLVAHNKREGVMHVRREVLGGVRAYCELPMHEYGGSVRDSVRSLLTPHLGGLQCPPGGASAMSSLPSGIGSAGPSPTAGAAQGTFPDTPGALAGISAERTFVRAAELFGAAFHDPSPALRAVAERCLKDLFARGIFPEIAAPRPAQSVGVGQRVMHSVARLLPSRADATRRPQAVEEAGPGEDCWRFDLRLDDVSSTEQLARVALSSLRQPMLTLTDLPLATPWAVGPEDYTTERYMASVSEAVEANFRVRSFEPASINGVEVGAQANAIVFHPTLPLVVAAVGTEDRVVVAHTDRMQISADFQLSRPAHDDPADAADYVVVGPQSYRDNTPASDRWGASGSGVASGARQTARVTSLQILDPAFSPALLALTAAGELSITSLTEAGGPQGTVVSFPAVPCAAAAPSPCISATSPGSPLLHCAARAPVVHTWDLCCQHATGEARLTHDPAGRPLPPQTAVSALCARAQHPTQWAAGLTNGGGVCLFDTRVGGMSAQSRAPVFHAAMDSAPLCLMPCPYDSNTIVAVCEGGDVCRINLRQRPQIHRLRLACNPLAPVASTAGGDVRGGPFPAAPGPGAAYGGVADFAAPLFSVAAVHPLSSPAAPVVVAGRPEQRHALSVQRVGSDRRRRAVTLSVKGQPTACAWHPTQSQCAVSTSGGRLSVVTAGDRKPQAPREAAPSFFDDF